MATGWPMKTTYANGDVYSASDVNDITGTINLLGSSVAYAAGKNKLINGDFGVWQRGTSFTNPANNAYLADRFSIAYNGTAATRTVSQQTFTPGTAPVAGYEGTYFLRCDTTNAGSSNTTLIIRQAIEDVRTFAGQTVTFSFWMKSGTAGRSCSVDFNQQFGSGGSSPVDGTNVTFTSSDTWTRHSFTIAIPSVSGKTIGTSSYIYFRIFLTPGIIETFDIWGAQVESGSTATAFQTATGTIQGELAACQRYLPALNASSASSSIGSGYAYGTNAVQYVVPFQVPARVAPTGVTISSASHIRWASTAENNATAASFNQASTTAAGLLLTVTATSGTGGMAYFNSTSGQILFTGCEL